MSRAVLCRRVPLAACATPLSPYPSHRPYLRPAHAISTPTGPTKIMLFWGAQGRNSQSTFAQHNCHRNQQHAFSRAERRVAAAFSQNIRFRMRLCRAGIIPHSVEG